MKQEGYIQTQCPRCNKKLDSQTLCNNCKSELAHNYDHGLDWKTAWQIEIEAKELRKLNFNID
ncbi:MAG: hypothetical protein ACLFUC_08915 [Bacteroidales bacterium]